MALTPLGTVDIDLEQVTATGPIEATSEEEDFFAFDIHLVGLVVTVIADSRDDAEAWRHTATEDFEPSDTFEAGGFILDLGAVQAVSPTSEYEDLDGLHPTEASFEVFLEGTVAELVFTTLSAADQARQELVEAVNEDDEDDEDEVDDEDEEDEEDEEDDE